MVINHLLTGMVLQVATFPRPDSRHFPMSHVARQTDEVYDNRAS